MAGDTVRSAADLGLPLVTVTLASRAGYFGRTIDASGQQHEQPDSWDPSAFAKRLDARVCVTIEDQPMWVGGFLFVVQSHVARGPTAGRLRRPRNRAQVWRNPGVQLDAIGAELKRPNQRRGQEPHRHVARRVSRISGDLDVLRSVAKSSPFQLVIAGKAHPQDVNGKEVIQRIHQNITVLSGVAPAVCLPNYDMALAKKLVAGCDVWLNTPLRPMDASGTSGMKAAFNGVPNLSVLDGWCAKGCIEGVTGSAVGSRDPSDDQERDASIPYKKMRDIVLPLYYGERSK